MGMRNAYAGDGGTVGRVPARVDVCRYRGAGDCDRSGIIQLRPGMNSWLCTHSGLVGHMDAARSPTTAMQWTGRDCSAPLRAQKVHIQTSMHQNYGEEDFGFNSSSASSHTFLKCSPYGRS